MSIFKCKMCGGDLDITDGQTVCECEYCGSKQTVPNGDNEKKTNLFNRANRLRIACEFDKAAGIYENIISEFPEEAEAYWGLCLCNYGIEYVEDPASHKRVPTCHRAQYESVMTDADYIAALENSDISQQGIYTQQAIEISEIQKGILAIVKDEKPFDVFICYKESDENGKRTIDSSLANDIYYQLTQEGLKVFYAAITLEDKLGQEYEPYIFAALNSSKVMLVVGTKPEYFEAVWVRNEWSRFLKIMGNDRSKLLIPCYRDMDAYDLPEEFAHLQAQDMSKIGFVNDVVRGIKKVVDGTQPKTEAVKETVVVNNNANGGSNISALIDRGFMALEDGEWQKADGFFEEALNQDAKNAECYLGKLMAELSVKSKDNLKNCAQPFDDKNNCIKASKFSAEIADKLKSDNKFIRDRNETARKQGIYDEALGVMRNAESESEFKSAASGFGTIAGFKDADEQKKACLDKAEIARKDTIYYTAKGKMTGNVASTYRDAIKWFESIIDWKDSRVKIDECNKKIEDIRIANEKAEAERKRKAEEARIAAEKAKAKKKKIAMIVTPIVAVVIVFLIILNSVILPASNYKKALAAVESGNYSEAYILFNKCSGYKDADSKLLEIMPGYYKEKFANAKAGDIITFGSYEQDNDTSNGKEAIEWRVLEVKDGKALIISEKALDCVQYNEEYGSTTWENCTLRTWLNGTFYKAAFSSEEQKMIQSTKVTADANPNYDTDPGNDTTDKVFLLSITEAEKYFSSDDDMICKPTDYAVSNGAYVYESTGGCWWWLRSPGYGSTYAACVYCLGGVDRFGIYVDNDDGCVRPALWIEI